MPREPKEKIDPAEQPVTDANGLRDVTEAEALMLVAIRRKEAELVDMLAAMENLSASHGDREAGRWLALARNNLETGIMYSLKAVTRPKSGLGRRQPK